MRLAHHPGAAKLFGALQRSLHARDANVEDSVGCVVRSASDPAANAYPILGGDEL
jgi:hypothetical protein